MKKYFTFIMIAAAFVACTGVEQPELIENPDTQKAYTMTIKASKDVDTKALSLSGSTLNATWNDNEQVLVYQNSTQIGTLYAAASSSASTTLSGVLDYAPDPDVALTFYFHTNLVPNPSKTAFITNGQYHYYDGQDGTLETIASTYDFCSPATVNSGNFTVDTDNQTVNAPNGISFGSNLQAIVKFTLVDKANPETKLNPSSLTVTASRQSQSATTACDFNYEFTILASTYETNGDGIVYLAIPAYFRLTTNPTPPEPIGFGINATVGSETYVYGRADFPFANGQYYDITVKMGHPISATEADLGKIIGKDGQIYENVDAATTAGTSAVAMIAYVGNQTGELAPYNHGLAIALNDCPDGGGDHNPNYQYYTQTSGFQTHPITAKNTSFKIESGLQYNTLHKNYIDGNGFLYPAFRTAIYSFFVNDRPSCFSEWFLATGFQWQQMINAMGSFSDLRTAFSSVGGTDMAEAIYWTSTQNTNPTTKAWYVSFSGNGGWGQGVFKDDYYKVRPVLAF